MVYILELVNGNMLTIAEHFEDFLLAINDSGTVRRINEVYVNDGGSLRPVH